MRTVQFYFDLSFSLYIYIYVRVYVCALNDSTCVWFEKLRFSNCDVLSDSTYFLLHKSSAVNRSFC